MFTSKFKQHILGGLSVSLLISTAHAAAVLDYATWTEPFYNLPPYALSKTDVSDGTAKAYRAWFENGTYTGDIIEYDVSAGGVLSTSVDFSVAPPTNSGSNWSARIQFDTAVAASSTYWDTGRKIIMGTAGGQAAFRWGNLSDTQKAALDAAAVAASATSSSILNFLRGDQSNEKPNGNDYRKRFNLLGDIIHSNPVYVAAPDSPFVLPGYTTFRNRPSTDATTPGRSDRAGRVYVGSNDGMLHAFDAATGNEVWSYVPSMIIGDLKSLIADPATHRYFVDGQLNEGDADFGSSPTIDWHSLLVGGLGSGGKGLFVLDITDADLSAETANSGVDRKVLFEKDGTDTDMGHIHGKIQIARLPEIHSNAWAFVTGNGYGSTDGKAKLLIISKDGTVTKVSTDDTIAGNGLSAPTLVDVDSDFDVDYGYAGDLKGNLWKFNFTTSPVTVTKLFAGSANQPITSQPDIRIHPNGGRLVYFGTGSLLSATDSANTDTQSVYAIWDGAPAGNTSILTQTLATDTYTYTSGSYEVTQPVRVVTNTVVNWAVHRGWKIDLNISGERMVTNPIMRADRLQFVTHNPIASANGKSWLLELNYLNGGTGPGPFYDLNRDGVLNSTDKTAVPEIPVGLDLGEGSYSGPTIARVTNSRDTKFINGLFLDLKPPCTNNCGGGFQLGHADVDTDSPNGAWTAANSADRYCYFEGKRPGNPVDASGNEIVPPSATTPLSRTAPGDHDISGFVGNKDGHGGEVDGHQHEYDKAHGQVYIDFINTEPLCGQRAASSTAKKTVTNSTQKLERMTEVNMGNSKKFIAIVANADLSPGSTFTIGTKKWNGLVYQKMVQKAYKNWTKSISAGGGGGQSSKFDAYMIDDAGASLLYSIDDILASGTMRHAFNDRAIADGGLLPTVYSCVTNDAEENISTGANTADTGRWRGGSLVTQLIDADLLKDNPNLIVEQNPTDLYRKRVIDGVDVTLKEDNLDASGNPGTDGVYDTFYGGLIARYRNDPVGGATLGTKLSSPNLAFLYEMSIYWHYTGSCYGSSNWNADVVGAANSGTTPALKDTIASLEYDLETVEVKIEALIAAGASADDIAKYQAIRTQLTEKIATIRDALSPNVLEYTGIVTPPTDTTDDISPSLGPNFRTGRRTWIDLTN